MRTRSTKRFRTSAPLHCCHGCKPLPFTVPRLVWVSLIIAECTADWQFWANTTRTALPDSWNIVPGRKTFSPFQFIWSSSNSMVATSEDQRYQRELKASAAESLAPLLFISTTIGSTSGEHAEYPQHTEPQGQSRRSGFWPWPFNPHRSNQLRSCVNPSSCFQVRSTWFHAKPHRRPLIDVQSTVL